ncbi:tyrosine-type recombinase/integrase [Cesiribacter andamanensis]|uniref:Site-specific recombinase XerD n=1 Tax=Cesiribacter andamanensis AMV16 TaxID=1279009 RepID=M7N759_9BACT|nr:tyrosine-type recombinase/integrase [Cesiribacter andamanensis]EMR04448.1 Site-specific recombinase XerD [Cesiribacter andamanensis AMV16]
MTYVIKLDRRPLSKGENAGKHPVILEYRYKGKQYRDPVGIYCAPQHWNEATQQIGSGYSRKEQQQLNALILAKRDQINQVLLECSVHKIEPSGEHVLAQLRYTPSLVEDAPKKEEQLGADMVPLFQEWLDQVQVPKYTHTLPHLKAFAQHRGGLKAAELSEALLAEFAAYLQETGYIPYSKASKAPRPKPVKKERVQFSNTTLKNHVKYLKLFGRQYLTKKGYPVNQDFRDFELKFKSPEIGDTIALTKQEFDRLYYLDVSAKKHLHVTKLAFIVGTALGGLRISDLKRLQASDFKGDDVSFTQQKTGGKVTNPISEHYVKPLLDEFLAYKELIPSGQKLNDNLKVLAALAGLDRVEKIYEYRGGSRKGIEKEVRIQDHISSKYMRKTLVSVLVSLGYGKEIIKEFTGHQDDRVIDHYIQVHRQTKVQVLDSFRPDPANAL